MTKEMKTQWHPAFCSAMRLEFREYAEYLEYINEFNLTRKPLQIDLLIIKKKKNMRIRYCRSLYQKTERYSTW